MKKSNYFELLYTLFGLLLIYIILFFGIFTAYGFNPNQEIYLTNQCFNVSFSQCQDIRNLYNQTPTLINFTQSNETNLILSVNTSFQNNLNSLNHSFQRNITDLNFILSHLDFSKYNNTLSITSVNRTLFTKISNLENKLNTLAGNNTDLTFQTMFSNALKLQQYKQQKQQIDSIFKDSTAQPKTSSLTLDNLKNYINRSELDSRLSQIQQPQNVDTSQFLAKGFIFVLFGIFLVGIGYLFIELNKLKLQLRTKSKEIEIETSYDTPEFSTPKIKENDKGKKSNF